MIPYIVFYSSIAFILYVYLGYPVLLWFWRRFAGRRVQKTNYEPPVSIIVAAYNERASIERKILNLMELDYPAGKMQIIFALDGPTDDTESVARKYEFETARMQVLHVHHHGGKAEALNQAVAQSSGNIIVFADARQLLDRTAVRELMSNFEDPSVGAVTGELMLLDEFGKEAGDAVGLYWRYEKQLRSMESDIHSTLGATGALYAIRRDLYRPIPSHTILDDVAIPMNAVLDGKRVVFDRAARAYDSVVNSPSKEFARKVRTLAGNFQLLKQMPELLAPWRNPVLIQFVSHKVGRLLVPYFLIMLFASNFPLQGTAYRGILALQFAFYLLACVGSACRKTTVRGQPSRIMKSLVLFPYTLVLMNWAAVVGLSHFVRGRHDVWSGYESAPSRLKENQLPELADGHDTPTFSDAAYRAGNHRY
jgi:cellulose synthase/poly-beta-1,6-N-acetylglucosamine synthase-like glycosyltransferase